MWIVMKVKPSHHTQKCLLAIRKSCGIEGKNRIAVKPRQIHVAPTKKARQYGEPLLFQAKET
jgi:hypothetical protein